MNALKIAAVGAEITVIGALAVSSYRIAFAGHEADWLAGAPLAVVVALESMRLPLAFRLPRMRVTGLVLSVAMLAGLSVVTGEAASLAFENLIFERAKPVAEAEAALKRVQIDHEVLALTSGRCPSKEATSSGFFAVLHLGAIKSPADAVRVAIAAEHRRV